jgi:hypothetical protein
VPRPILTVKVTYELWRMNYGEWRMNYGEWRMGNGEWGMTFYQDNLDLFGLK